MATKNVSELTALAAAPAVDDVIPIWDLTASAYKKITVANFLGGYMTGAGTVATGGFTLTVPATGTAALLSAANAFTGANTFTSITASSSVVGLVFRSVNTGIIADDTVYSVATGRATGVALLTSIFSNTTAGRRNSSCMIAFDTSVTASCAILWQPGAQVAATTGALANGDGTDAVLTVSTHTDGNLYISNRNGFTVNLSILFFG